MAETPEQSWLPVEDDESLGDIIRVEKRERWVTVENETARDKRLSWGARGLLTYLLTHKRGWKIKISDLVRQSPNAKRDAIYTVIRELRIHRYMVRKSKRQRNGRFGWYTAVYESPVGAMMTEAEMKAEGLIRAKRKKDLDPILPLTDKPLAVEPETGGPLRGKPHTGEPDTVKPEINTSERRSEESLSEERLLEEERTHTEREAVSSVGTDSVCVSDDLTFDDFREFARNTRGFGVPNAWARVWWPRRNEASDEAQLNARLVREWKAAQTPTAVPDSRKTYAEALQLIGSRHQAHGDDPLQVIAELRAAEQISAEVEAQLVGKFLPAADERAAAAWAQIAAHLRAALPAEAYETWFAQARPLWLKDARLFIYVPNAVIRDWITATYADVLTTALAACAGAVDVRDITWLLYTEM